jgi:hypothetical protein
MLRSVEWWLGTDVSEQPICTIFKDQEVLTLEDGTDRLCRNVGPEPLLNAVCVLPLKSSTHMKKAIASYEDFTGSSVPSPYMLVVKFCFLVVLLNRDNLARYVRLEAEF